MQARALAEGLGSRLRELRKARGFTQEALATLGGVTQQTVHQYEKGTTLPSLEFVYALNEQGFDIPYLLFGSTMSANALKCPDWVMEYIGQTIAKFNQTYAAGRLSEVVKVKMTIILLKRYLESADSLEMDEPVLMETLLKGA